MTFRHGWSLWGTAEYQIVGLCDPWPTPWPRRARTSGAVRNGSGFDADGRSATLRAGPPGEPGPPCADRTANRSLRRRRPRPRWRPRRPSPRSSRCRRLGPALRSHDRARARSRRPTQTPVRQRRPKQPPLPGAPGAPPTRRATCQGKASLFSKKASLFLSPRGPRRVAHRHRFAAVARAPPRSSPSCLAREGDL